MKNDSQRLNLSLGLIASYVAFMVWFVDKFQYEGMSGFFKLIYIIVVVYWGFASLLLVLFVFIHGLGLKYSNRYIFDIYEYKFKIKPELKKKFFDIGIEIYCTSVFLALLQAMPVLLANSVSNTVLEIIFFLIATVVLVILLSLLHRILTKVRVVS